jgi:hypothetical protein
MSSSRIPSLNGEGVVNDALEQSQPHSGPVYQNADQSAALAAAHSEATEAPSAQESSRPGGYTKLTSTDHPEAPDEELDLVDQVEGEQDTPFLDSSSDYNPESTESPGELTEDRDGEPEPTLSPVSGVDTATAPADGDSEPPSEAPHAGTRSSTETADLIPRIQESLDEDPQAAKEELEASRTETPLGDDVKGVTQEDATHDNAAQETPAAAAAAAAAEEVDSTPAPKFDPRVNIFEWTAPSGADPARAQQWTSAVKQKVDYIRNFQLGGDVLRALIREHRDDLVALREQLFG